jgi:hypothetical protein
MTSLIVQGIILILFWYSSWTILDIANDSLSGDNVRLRFTFSVLLFILALFILWIVLSIGEEVS